MARRVLVMASFILLVSSAPARSQEEAAHDWFKPLVPPPTTTTRASVPRITDADATRMMTSLNGTCVTALRSGTGPLSERLARCPWVVQRIVWETPTGGQLAYPEWTDAQRQRLDLIFERLRTKASDLGLDCPNPVENRARTADPGGARTTFYTARQAFDVYAAHVAHALLLEAERAVPWSILLSLSALEVSTLLSSESMVSSIASLEAAPAGTYYPPHIAPGRDYQLPAIARGANGVGLLCDPRVGYRFVRGQISTSRADLLGKTDEETMANLTRWMAENVAHGGGTDGSEENLARANLLRDRLRGVERPYVPAKIIIAARGCHSAALLLRDLARSVNIPLVHGNVSSGTIHSGLLFRAGRASARILPHLDNIYAMETAPPFALRSDGTPAPAAEGWQRYFEALWLPPAKLSPYGFSAAEPVAHANATPTYGYPRFQIFLGTFATTNMLYLVDANYELCTYRRFVNDAGSAAQQNFDRYSGTGAQHTREEYRERARTVCPRAHGGSAAMAALDNAWRQTRGSSLLAEISSVPTISKPPAPPATLTPRLP